MKNSALKLPFLLLLSLMISGFLTASAKASNPCSNIFKSQEDQAEIARLSQIFKTGEMDEGTILKEVLDATALNRWRESRLSAPLGQLKSKLLESLVSGTHHFKKITIIDSGTGMVMDLSVRLKPSVRWIWIKNLGRKMIGRQPLKNSENLEININKLDFGLSPEGLSSSDAATLAQVQGKTMRRFLLGDREAAFFKAMGGDLEAFLSVVGESVSELRVKNPLLKQISFKTSSYTWMDSQRKLLLTLLGGSRQSSSWATQSKSSAIVNLSVFISGLGLYEIPIFGHVLPLIPIAVAGYSGLKGMFGKSKILLTIDLAPEPLLLDAEGRMILPEVEATRDIEAASAAAAEVETLEPTVE